MIPTTVDELRAAMAHAPGDARILLFLHNPPRAGYLGHVIYDPEARTLDLHCTDVCQTSPGLPQVVPSEYPRSCT